MSGDELCFQHQSDWRCPSPCMMEKFLGGAESKARTTKEKEGEVSPGVHLSVRGPDLAGATVFGGGARGRAAAAPGAAALAQVYFALGLPALPT